MKSVASSSNNGIDLRELEKSQDRRNTHHHMQ